MDGMSAPDLPNVLFTAAEGAGLLRVDPKTVQQWVRRGKLSSAGYTPGGAQLFAWPDLVAARTTRVARHARLLDPIRLVKHPLP